MISDQPIGSRPLLLLDCLHLLEEQLHVHPIISLVKLKEIKLIEPPEAAEHRLEQSPH
jgi:hypothetical protein